ncbi:uncharacterized protein LOC142628744 [Castanea sativa]|uniref:uncharacterized protein LOC142628744 n=1 Tax=Castanea sativa TaxID=21020 RepID=UPI003F6538A1
MYNGRTDPVEHVSHFNQRMAVHSKNVALMCNVFSSSLGPVAMRWFDGLGSGSIDSFKELTQAFGSCFITCSRVPRPLDSLLSMTMREGETLKTYTDRYREMFNEIDGDFDDVAIRTFKEDQQLGKVKVKVASQDRRDFRSDKYNDNRPRRDFTRQTGAAIVPQAVNMVFREPAHQILEKIKNESYFKWPNKMSGDPAKRNQNLHCQYHQERGHNTENCKTLWYHLEQLVRDGRLKQFLYRPNGQADHIGSDTQGNTSSRPLLGTINVIVAAPGRTGSCPSHVMTVARPLPEDSNYDSKRAKVAIQLALSFSEKDKVGTIQPHDDALVVMLKIGEDSPLVGFDGKMVIPMGQVKLLVQTGIEVVEVNFIVVDAYSPYTAIMARP